MGTSYKELFKLYDLIQCGESSSVDRFLTENAVGVNSILPCKGIGILHLAVGIDPLDKSKECTEIILKHGGDPNLCTEDWLTPVHIAAIWGRVDNLKLLIACGGDPSKQDVEGHSAFDYAVSEQQWEVYDYLHNVVDESNDSLECQCACTLDLERILVTTDQMVAEYEPVTDSHSFQTLCRKSDMIRDWCDKNTLVINKLYPTILGDTYLLENESAPWKSIDFTKNSTNDLTKDINMNHDKINETELSLETSLTKKLSSDANVEISGVKPLEKSAGETEHLCSCNYSIINPNCNLQKQHISIYENFSLPSSPNSIIHINYNSKSTIKKKPNKEFSQNTEVKEKCTLHDSRSLLIDDHSEVDLDKALAVVQNKTNEWLSTNGKNSDCHETDVKTLNTRRSSTSSGVSSNFSGGSIALANIQEEYKYKDKIENITLIEKRLLVSPIVLPVEETCDEHDHTVSSVASSLPTSVEYDIETLRVELSRLGFKPGPIQENNKTLYLKKLHSLKKNGPKNVHVVQNLVAKNVEKVYSVELAKSLRTDEWMKNLSPYLELESKARTDFSSSNKKWREGTAKTSFTYLLLDPRLTDNLPAKAGNQSNHVSWITFINSIFYVGKGKRSRPYSHLYQALTLWKSKFTKSPDKKVQHILDIWSDKVGVVCLHIFQNVIPAEAYTYEAAMIDVLGLSNLKNLKSGNYYGVVATWPLKERKMLGLYLLYKAMLIFLNEGERQLRPDDID